MGKINYLNNKTNININNYYKDVVSNKIQYSVDVFVAAQNPSISTTEETIWNYTGKINYLTVNTNLYLSSTNAGDNQVFLVRGLNSDLEQVVGLTTLNGQNQVLVSEQFYRVYSVYNLGTTNNAGDVYLAEQDTLTGGIPNTASKVQMKILSGNNFGSNATYTVGKNREAYLYQFTGSAGEGKDVQVFLNIRPIGGLFIKIVPIRTYQGRFNIFDISGLYLPEGTDIEISAIATVPTAGVSVMFKIVDSEVI